MKIYGVGKRGKTGMVTGMKLEHAGEKLFYGKYTKIKTFKCKKCGIEFASKKNEKYCAVCKREYGRY